ncbi:SAM-dependent methyltransferase [Kangiella aquimarina]|uniref:SAM-dependent methyltransferase n=1 Tax=Kangiella aquimarina TaxID=261965 RepID=A0ABZ0X478_9GAMM|nr:SAM-dependent methyltransferase [Kangiella aquimarina]WQG85324.1 SAM-dependent methyltransferase [Kangiella aquimarina]
MNKKGRLVCVGTGIKLMVHMTPISKQQIEQADIVFMAVASSLMGSWIKELNPNIHDLGQYYEQGKSRLETYKQMIAAIMQEVRAGKNVCAAFYGHPGVFALAPHRVIETARKEGFEAHMEPGISAEDCLYADLAIDPGKFGCQHYETTQYMIHNKNIEPSAYLILWQIGIAGDQELTQFETTKEKLEALKKKLTAIYPESHEVILYESAAVLFKESRIEKLQLQQLANVETSLETTLVIPPVRNK